MTATRCTFDVRSERCADCGCLYDCIDAHLPMPPITIAAPEHPDAPLKLLRPNTPRARRRLHGA